MPTRPRAATTVAVLSAAALCVTATFLVSAPASATTVDDLTTVDGYPTTGQELALREPVRTTSQDLTGLPDGVSVDRVEWITDRYVRLHINSAAMPGTPTEVELLLARDWNSSPDATFPTVLHLAGLYGNEASNGWLTATDAVDFYADKNVTVVMPVGGQASWYTDWVNTDNGETLMWETFLADELPAVLQAGWRANGVQAVEGLSMGATSALNLAARNPGEYAFAGAFSGILDTTSPGVPEAIDLIQRVQGRASATNMWGPFYSAGWQEHDPTLQVGNLAGTSVYVTAGSGTPGEFDPVPTDASTLTGQASVSLVESLSATTSRAFASAAAQAGIPVTTVFHPTGTHRWRYWERDMHDAWPQLAAALNVIA
ncbi:alpha/beta hydrolase [Corynebacterium terpenotabidum]|uniref:Trehalose corynomycolyl transferase n=1 Tax=Corynebacterium terpenotabidum Y-11 TaxID=1200352 RepID=S4XKB1_9CORY|nr:alpha/beta hydrolase family protein [Corynebacterium terpenotabidum]AGP30998.1 trehalose corynomycolyl transferase [Corynebacterium terpenotabidum Y-11]